MFLGGHTVIVGNVTSLTDNVFSVVAIGLSNQFENELLIISPAVRKEQTTTVVQKTFGGPLVLEM